MKPSNCKIKKCKTNSMCPYSHDEDLHFCLCSFTSWKIMNTNKQERVCNLCIKPQYYDNNQKNDLHNKCRYHTNASSRPKTENNAGPWIDLVHIFTFQPSLRFNFHRFRKIVWVSSICENVNNQTLLQNEFWHG